ncbi:hypothetical protein [Desulfogranum japonicum]|uniref:hypothetical protein n=1 Tax=Desulfogranum japonicum TaxID=231447 RepID=UPI000427DEE0|nr:hypothetical protein [Desulfogranum japonicum]
MSADNIHTTREIAEDLAKRCRERQTGVAYIVSENNRSGQIMLDQGTIVYVYYSNKRGEEAIDLLAVMDSCRYRFQEGSLSVTPMKLPATGDILRLLVGKSIPETDVKDAQHPDQERAKGAGQPLTDEQIAILEKALATCIGPMATIICEDCLDPALDFDANVQALAAEIPSADQVEKFKNLIAKHS